MRKINISLKTYSYLLILSCFIFIFLISILNHSIAVFECVADLMPNFADYTRWQNSAISLRAVIKSIYGLVLSSVFIGFMIGLIGKASEEQIEKDSKLNNFQNLLAMFICVLIGFCLLNTVGADIPLSHENRHQFRLSALIFDNAFSVAILSVTINAAAINAGYILKRMSRRNR